MLRSLVGSEMCIRDRDQKALFIHGIVHNRIPFFRILFFGFLVGDNLNTCLLYTSDAADDLLCVDLGGRRIIKKKKNKQTTHDRSYTQNNQITHMCEIPHHMQ